MQEPARASLGTYTFRSHDGNITASVQMGPGGDVFIRMKPHNNYTEKEMYALLGSMGFEETLAPLWEEL